MFNRRAARGQCFHQPCLGTREFAAAFESIPHHAPLPSAIPETRDLGFMLWDIDHAAPGRPSLFFQAQLRGGVMAVPQPSSPEIRR
jgi:CRISPR-associated protein Cas5d